MGQDIEKIEEKVIERVDSKEIEFESPLVINGEKIEKVIMRKPTGNDLLLTSSTKGKFERDIDLIILLTGLKCKREELLVNDAVEILQLQGELMPFLLTSKAQLMLLQQLQK